MSKKWWQRSFKCKNRGSCGIKYPILADTNTFEKRNCAFRFAIYLLTTKVLCFCSDYCCLKRKIPQCPGTICTLSICLYIPAASQIDRKHPRQEGCYSTHWEHVCTVVTEQCLLNGVVTLIHSPLEERERDGKTRRGWERGVLGRREAYEAGLQKAWWKWLIAGEVRGQG